MTERHARSLIKAVTWRITGSLDTFLLTLLVTGAVKIALSVSGFELFTKIGLFWLHERIWNAIGWGRDSLTVTANPAD